MTPKHLKIGFIRRGFSRSGGAEAYLKRLAAGVRAVGHAATLVTTSDWPASEWPFGQLIALKGKTPTQFADAVDGARLAERCDVIMSLERVRHCDVYRAGDGVHRAWLERRKLAGGAIERLSMALNSKHRRILRLEAALFAHGGARRVIANSQMVKQEIENIYGYPSERIAVIPNGVPVEQFRFTASERVNNRAALNLMEDDVAVLFVGSGWERKGLIHVLHAIEKLDNRHCKLLVAGRGDVRRYRSSYAQFLGEVGDVRPLYGAADIFVLPTLYDPFSNACLEALASGLPVITTKSNGFAEVIEDGRHGTIIDQPNWGAVAAAITFWSDRARRLAAHPAILELAAKYDIAHNVTRTLEILLRNAGRAD